MARFGGCDFVTCCDHRACLALFVRFALVGLVSTLAVFVCLVCAASFDLLLRQGVVIAAKHFRQPAGVSRLLAS